MTLAVSLILILVGAAVRFALTRTTWHEWNVHTLGVIGMVVGGIGVVASLLARIPRRRKRAVEVDEPARSRTHAHAA